MRVEEIQLTPLELGLHKCPNKCLPLTIETQELLASVDTLREIYPLHYTDKDKRVLPCSKRPRTK